jgi:hypothetical protein
VRSVIRLRWYRWVVLAALVLVAGATLLTGRCRPDSREAIRVEEGRVVVTNLTGTAWSDVEVWLNGRYRAMARELRPDQRLEVPLDVFVAGYGQRFEPHRQEAAGLEVTARDEKGERITLTWGAGRGR